VPQRKSKTNHQFLKGRYQEEPKTAKRTLKQRERSKTMQQPLELTTTPMPKADCHDHEQIQLGKRCRRLNSQEFEQLLKLEDPSTAQDSHHRLPPFAP
jgi:hypothetical protein